MSATASLAELLAAAGIDGPTVRVADICAVSKWSPVYARFVLAEHDVFPAESGLSLLGGDLYELEVLRGLDDMRFLVPTPQPPTPRRRKFAANTQ